MKTHPRLNAILTSIESPFAVALSGGVDSSFLLWAAVRAKGKDSVLAVTAKAPYVPAREVEDARRSAAAFGVRHVITVLPLPEEIKNNPENRCYLCKRLVFASLLETARQEGFPVLMDASHAGDDLARRPGARALAEYGIRSPLREAGLGKEEIRALARRAGVAVWAKPSFSCLMARFPRDERVSEPDLELAERAEETLAAMGFRTAWIRVHGQLARIEVESRETSVLFRKRKEAAARLHALGFRWVSMDLDGYRTGSMD